MDLTFQVPLQYCSLQHRTLLSPLDTCTIRCCFHCGSASSLLLELFLHSSTVAYWAPTDLGEFIFQCHIFSPFHIIHWILNTRSQSTLSFFFPPVDHILSELTTMTHRSWVALQGMAHSFTELEKTVIHVINLVSFM